MRRNVLIIVVVLLMFLCGCVQQKSLEDSFYVSILPQKYFVERITGGLFSVKVLVEPGASPATYEPTAKQMVGLSQAQALFTIGVAFEEQLIPKIRGQYKELEIVATDINVPKLRPESFIELFSTTDINMINPKANKLAEHSHNHSHEGLDPHIWLSPDLVKIQLAEITDYFVAHYPDQKELFINNRDSFYQDLDEASHLISDIFSTVGNKEFLCFHPAWGYFAKQFGLKQIPIEIEGKEPTPQEQHQILKFVEARGIKVIFVQQQFDKRIAQAIAEQIGGKVIPINPLAENYLENLHEIATKLAGSMEQ